MVTAAPRSAASSPAAAPPVPLTGVVRAGPADAELLAAFHRAAWDPAATAESVRAALRAAAARNPVHPGEPPPTFLFLVDGRPVGHLGTIPFRLWTAHGERPAHWLKGLMVLPSHRNGPVGFFLLREALSHVELALSAAVAPDARALLVAAGLTELGPVPNALRLLRPARVLRAVDPDSIGGLPRPARAAAALLRRSPALAAIAGGALRGACGAWTALRGGTGGLHAVVLPDWRTGELSRLWARARRGLRAAPSRDAAELRARYGGDGYRLLGVYEGGVLAGFAAVRPPRAQGDPRLGGARVATLSEIVAPVDRPAVLRALVAGAETVARSLDADALLCSATHPAARAALRRRAWLPFPGNVHLLLREPADAAAPLSRALDAWWLTRGDSHADEVF